MEKAMYPIIKTYLESLGYDVKAEVLNADIMAKKDDQVIIVEMKTTFSIKLIYQGLKRMHISDLVYLAIPKPTLKVRKSDTFHEKETITRRLELGLMLVDLKHENIEVLYDPQPDQLKKQKKKQNRLLKEFNTRKTTMNVGGVTKTKIITAYKELAIALLIELKEGPRKTSYLKTIIGDPKVVNILQMNYYGWYERVSKGVYQLTEAGYQALDDYQHVVEKLSY